MKLLTSFIYSLICFPALSHAQWVEYHKENGQVNFYLESKVRADEKNKVYSSVLTNFSDLQSIVKPDGKKFSFQSIASTLMYDCESKQFAIVDSMYYSGLSARGTSFSFSPEEPDKIKWLASNKGNLSQNFLPRIKSFCK